jgi:hypothetical protein
VYSSREVWQVSQDGERRTFRYLIGSLAVSLLPIASKQLPSRRCQDEDAVRALHSGTDNAAFRFCAFSTTASALEPQCASTIHFFPFLLRQPVLHPSLYDCIDLPNVRLARLRCRFTADASACNPRQRCSFPLLYRSMVKSDTVGSLTGHLWRLRAGRLHFPLDSSTCPFLFLFILLCFLSSSFIVFAHQHSHFVTLRRPVYPLS